MNDFFFPQREHELGVGVGQRESGRENLKEAPQELDVGGAQTYDPEIMT